MSEANKISITDKQAEIMAVCALCQRSIDTERVKELLEGGANPSRIFCGQCTKSPEAFTDAFMDQAARRCSQLLRRRAERAGLMAQYKRVAVEDMMRRDSKQN